MQTDALLREDHHVHSTFSDGRSTLEENVAQAERVGLGHLGCVDHVRADTTYHPDYAAAVRAMRVTTPVSLSIGIEAKILDADGRLDLPADGPGDDRPDLRRGPSVPVAGRSAVAARRESRSRQGRQRGALHRDARRGDDRGDAPQPHAIRSCSRTCSASFRRSDCPRIRCRTTLLAELASAAADTGTIVEISERWRCPSLRTLRAVRAAGAAIVVQHRQPRRHADRPLRLRPLDAAGARAMTVTSRRASRAIRSRIRWTRSGPLQRRRRRLMIVLMLYRGGTDRRSPSSRCCCPRRGARATSPPSASASSTSARFRSSRRSSSSPAIGLNRFHIGYERLRPFYPRVAVVVPAWNEANVIGTTIERLLAMDYPARTLRVYVVDDASTDATPDVVQAWAAREPDRVRHLRREKGGQGKAHTLNHGITQVLAEPWAEAVLIIDADVLFDASALRRMARHLSRPRRRGRHGLHQGGHRRRQLPHALHRLRVHHGAGGVAPGTERVRRHGVPRRRRTAALAREPGVDRRPHRHLDARGRHADDVSDAAVREARRVRGATPSSGPRSPAIWTGCGSSGCGGRAATCRSRCSSRTCGCTVAVTASWAVALFALIWFTVLLMPVCMVAASSGLLGLYLLDARRAWARVPPALDLSCGRLRVRHRDVVRRSIRPRPGARGCEGVLFPGVISLAIIVYSVAPEPVGALLTRAVRAGRGDGDRGARARRWSCSCTSGSAAAMLVAYLARWLAGRWRLELLPNAARSIRRLRRVSLRRHGGRLRPRDPGRGPGLGQDDQDRKGGAAPMSADPRLGSEVSRGSRRRHRGRARPALQGASDRRGHRASDRVAGTIVSAALAAAIWSSRSPRG